jgi:hypothetical protein
MHGGVVAEQIQTAIAAIALRVSKPTNGCNVAIVKIN